VYLWQQCSRQSSLSPGRLRAPGQVGSKVLVRPSLRRSRLKATAGGADETVDVVQNASAPRAPELDVADDGWSETDPRFAAVFQSAAIGIALVDMDGRPIAVNPALVEMLRYSAVELRQMVFTDFTHPDDAALDWKLFESMLRGERDSYRIDKRYFRGDGEIVYARLAVSLVRASDGHPEYAVAMVEDVTEREHAEEALRLSQEQRLGAQKMEAIGKLAGGIAHDFNNLLGVVIGTADLVESETGDLEAVSRRLAQIREAAERGASLTRQLLAFARRQVLDTEVVDLNEIVAGTLALLQRVIPESIEIETTLDPAVGSIAADRSQLEQVIMNLALNARDSMPDGGRLTLTTTPLLLDAPVSTPRVIIPAGSYAQLVVADTGHGMDEATMRQAFDPFFTMKGSHDGTGLGLSTVYGIVKQSGGHIHVESAPGEGARFVIHLPHSQATPTLRPPAHAASAAAKVQVATILLVEDEPSVRAVVSEMLKLAGHSVTVAATASEALAVSAQEPPFDLVISDIVMPDINGTDLVVLMRERYGTPVKTLFMSGYAQDRFELDANSGFLQKPFSSTELAIAVQAALDAC
jgi:two-component system cell cycle sensor histidine kinase/response regulator CckA